MSAASAAPLAGTDLEPLHRERLTPSAVVVAVAALTGAMFGVILVPISLVAALIVAIVLAVTAAVLLIAGSPVIEVRPDRVSAGPAHVAPELLGPSEVLEGEAWSRTMGQSFEPLAYHCTRGWMHAGVRVPLLDPDDPTTAWVMASRRPEALALALRAAHGGTA